MMVGRDLAAVRARPRRAGRRSLSVARRRPPTTYATSASTVHAGEVVGARRAWSAPAAPSWRSAIVGDLPIAPGSVESTGARCALPQPRDAVAPASASPPRSARPRRCCCAARCATTSPLARARPAVAAAASSGAAEERRSPRGYVAELQRPHAVDRAGGRQAVRRQPAEGRAGPLAGPHARSVLILDEPTRGIDVGAKAEIYRLIDELAGAGRGRPRHLLRAARGARARRPHRRDAARPHHRRADARRRHRRAHPGLAMARAT